MNKIVIQGGILTAVGAVESVVGILFPKPFGLERDIIIVAILSGWVGYASGCLVAAHRLRGSSRRDQRLRIALLILVGCTAIVCCFWYFDLYARGGITAIYTVEVYVSFSLLNGLLFFIAGVVGLQLLQPIQPDANPPS